MHPILADRERLVLYLAAWLPIAALLTAILARGGDIAWIESLAITAPMCLLYAFMCLASWYICRTAGSPLATLGTVTAAAFFSSTVWVLIGRTWAEGLEIVPSFAGLTDRYTRQIAIVFLSGVLLFLLAVAVHYVLLLLEESRTAERRALELQVFAREAELRALRAQIDPHFLFNSLNSISALAISNPTAARRMCLLLADFTRSSLVVGSKKAIALSDELKITENFLEIEKVRFGDRLTVNLQIATDCLQCRVPPLLIQPLLENAIKHGIAPLVEGGNISIEAQKLGRMLQLVVENPYDPQLTSSAGTGLGIRNVRERLSNLFAADARLELQREDGKFRVLLQVPGTDL
jgi:two-component system, LytTR family, sensor histidine kinase AlgZ